jgi:hypothetical protein
VSGKDTVPLTIIQPPDVLIIMKRFERLRPRTFYASAAAYRELGRPEHVKTFGNIISCTPTWDVDNAPEKWEATIVAAKEIVDFLNQEGIS